MLPKTNIVKNNKPSQKITLFEGYHRTKSIIIPHRISYFGYVPQEGGLYGPAWYLNRTLKHVQNNKNKSIYGNVIIKCHLDISKFLVFDPDLTQLVYGSQISLLEQFDYHNLTPTKEHIIIIKEWPKGFRPIDKFSKKDPEGFSSEIARALHLNDIENKSTKLKAISKQFDGIAYTGSKDGACFAVYNTHKVTPIAWKEDTVIYKTYTNKKVLIQTLPLKKRIKWEPISSDDYELHRAGQPTRVSSWVKEWVAKYSTNESAEHCIRIMTTGNNIFWFSIVIEEICKLKTDLGGKDNVYNTLLKHIDNKFSSIIITNIYNKYIKDRPLEDLNNIKNHYIYKFFKDTCYPIRWKKNDLNLSECVPNLCRSLTLLYLKDIDKLIDPYIEKIKTDWANLEKYSYTNRINLENKAILFINNSMDSVYLASSCINDLNDIISDIRYTKKNNNKLSEKFADLLLLFATSPGADKLPKTNKKGSYTQLAYGSDRLRSKIIRNIVDLLRY